MAIDRAISDAWRMAGVDLAIRVVAPFTHKLPDGRAIEFEAWLPDFGGPNGALVMSECSRTSIENSQIWSSVVMAAYRQYERRLFADTLDDWQWSGQKGDEPSWYSGRPWTSGG